MHPPDGILETVLYARDLEAIERFYAGIIGLEVVQHLPDRFVFLRCGSQMLLVFNPDHSRANDPVVGIPRHGTEGQGHVCFRVGDATGLAAWRDHLKASGVPIEHEHVWPGGAKSLYIRDPAGTSVEFAEPALWGLA
jgi:catechol 2,3-dioxygenase-like lactoylglutathione lyase family enzyme